MNIGMLWYDNSKKEFAEKIHQAAEYYEQKYGTQPNCAFVNPANMPLSGITSVDGRIVIRPSSQVLLNHVWMGVENG